MIKVTTVILAAGKSTRFKGPKSKLLQELAGLPIICHVVNLLFKKIKKELLMLLIQQKN